MRRFNILDRFAAMREPSGPSHALGKDAAQLRPFWHTPCVSCIRTVSMRLCLLPNCVTQHGIRYGPSSVEHFLKLRKIVLRKVPQKGECTHSMAYSRSIQERRCYIMYLATGDKGASQQLEPVILRGCNVIEEDDHETSTEVGHHGEMRI